MWNPSWCMRIASWRSWFEQRPETERWDGQGIWVLDAHALADDPEISVRVVCGACACPGGADRRTLGHMELFVIVFALCLLGLLATRFGYDSRDVLRSREDEAATTGMIWDARPL